VDASNVAQLLKAKAAQLFATVLEQTGSLSNQQELVYVRLVINQRITVLTLTQSTTVS
jgi:hypothetical protein